MIYIALAYLLIAVLTVLFLYRWLALHEERKAEDWVLIVLMGLLWPFAWGPIIRIIVKGNSNIP